jgi:hypothetical protein
MAMLAFSFLVLFISLGILFYMVLKQYVKDIDDDKNS